MKFCLSFLFFHSFCLIFGQSMDKYIRDSLMELELQKINYKKCDDLKKDFQNVSFKSLGKKIADEVIFDRTKKNIIINYRQPFSKQSMIIVDLFDYTPVYCNYENPSYNQSDFWSKEKVRYLQRKFHVNIIPYLHNKGQFVNKETIKTYINKNDKAIRVFLNQKKIEILGHFNANQGELCYFFPSKGFKDEKLDFNKEFYQEFEISFKNYLGKIISVRYSYDSDYEIYKTYQYKDKKWVEIHTTDDYKF